jgi:hypothetical protein
LARFVPSRQLQCRFCGRKHPDATEKERLIGGRDGASNRPRRAALEHRGNLTRTPRPACNWHAESCAAASDSIENTALNAKTKNQRLSSLQSSPPILTSTRCASLRTRPPTTSPGQCSLRSWFKTSLQPLLLPIHPPRVEASCLEIINPLPSAFARLRLVCCSWQNSRREILSAKSQSLSSTVNVERRGNRASNTLTGADGLYNGRSVSRQNQPPLRSRLRHSASSPMPLLAFPCIGQF